MADPVHHTVQRKVADVASSRRRNLARFLKRPGVQVERLTDKAWLVQRPDPSHPPLLLKPIDRRTWVVQSSRGRKRRVRQIGPKALRAHLLVDERASRASMGMFQKQLSDYLAYEQIAWMLRELDINCVLDVGANVGQYALQLREVGYTGRIVSFEPLEHLVELLRSAAARDHDWLVFDCALGDKAGAAEINVVPGTMSSLLTSSRFGKEWSAKLQDMRPETIQIQTLEAVFDQAIDGLDEPRVFLKMDTQGYDLQTFRGAGARLAEILGLQSEVSCVPIYDGMPRLVEQLTEYEAEGFEIAGMFPVTRHKETLRVIEFDMLMVRTQAMYHRSPG